MAVDRATVRRIAALASELDEGTGWIDAHAAEIVVAEDGGVTVIDMRTMTAVARHRSGVSPFGGSIRYVGGKASSR